MNANRLFKEFEAEFEKRKFVAGLLIAMIDFLKHLGALGGNYSSLKALLRELPRQEITQSGKNANTLIVVFEGKHLSLRPFYNLAEKFFRVDNKRFDYPNAAPHATQAWIDYERWFDVLLGMSDDDAEGLRTRVAQFVLDKLSSHEVDTSTLKPLARHFSALLNRFDPAVKKEEKPGAVFQGVVFAYLRADAPHLFMDVAKVGAGASDFSASVISTDGRESVSRCRPR